MIIFYCFFILLITVIIPLYSYYLYAQIPKKEIIFEDLNFPHEADIEYCRDIPFDNDIFKAYGIAIHFNIMDNKSNLIGALLLRWIKLGYISIVQDSSVDDFVLKIPADLVFDNEIEQNLLNILKKASKENKILEYREFKSYCNSNYIEIINWFHRVDFWAEELLKTDGYIKEKNVVVHKMFNLINRLDTHKIITKKASKKAIELLGLKKYLLNYSSIYDKSSVEVTLWDNYLIFAQLLGIARSVDKDFKNLYLDYTKIYEIYRFESNR